MGFQVDTVSSTSSSSLTEVAGGDFDFKSLDVRKDGKKVMFINYDLSAAVTVDGQASVTIPKAYVAGDKFILEVNDREINNTDYTVVGTTLTFSNVYVDSLDKVVVKY